MTQKEIDTAEAARSACGETPLESWKEIAAYIQRDIRTAKRWEKSEGLPVHRHLHQARSSVYAYPSELESWRARRRPGAEAPARPLWRQPLASTAFALVILMALASAGGGPRVGSAQAADGIVTRQVWVGHGAGSVSRDGRHLAFTDWRNRYGDVAVRDLATGETRFLTGAASPSQWANFTVLSPDGKRVAYSWYNEAEFYDLRIVGLDGSRPRVLYRDKDTASVEPADWSSDGKYILAHYLRGDYQIATISVADGSLRLLKNLGRRGPEKMYFSPDGRYIVYSSPPNATASAYDIFVLAADGSRVTPLVEHPANDYVLGWAPDGNSILFASDRTGSWDAWLVPVADGKARGNPVQVKRDAGRIYGLGFTRRGSFYYMLGGWMMDVYTAAVDLAAGKLAEAPTPAVQRFMGANGYPAWSPDGRYLAYGSRRTPASGSVTEYVLCIRSAETGAVRELRPELNWFGSLRWSPDGRSIMALGFDRNNRRAQYLIDTQTGAVRSILPQERWACWSADGKAILYWASGRSRILARDLETGEEKDIASVPGVAVVAGLKISPDGRKLAMRTWREKPESTSLAVMPAQGGPSRELLRIQSPEQIRDFEWTPDSRYLLFFKAAGGPPQQEHCDLGWIPAEGGEPKNLGLSMQKAASLTVHPDGRRIAFFASKFQAEVWVMENLPASPGTAQQRVK